MSPEERVRQRIDQRLTASGWVGRSKDAVNLPLARGGLVKAHQRFGVQLPKRVDELNEVLAA